MSYANTLEEVSAASELLPALWVEKYQILSESGLPIDLDGNHRFLRDIYNDLSPLQVQLKPPQIGATVMNIIKSFWVAKKMGKDIIYTLPTASDVNDMAGGKINRLVAQNHILKEWVKDKDTVEQKSVGDNIIYYRGTFSNKQAMMVSSDLNIHDEVDASDAGVITQYETRLQAKANGWRWYFSHPSISGHGVDIYWQQSDKKEWFVTCSACKRIQMLKWPDNIEVVTRKYVCSLCHAELSDKDRMMGQWSATSAGVFSGFHISQLMCPWITADAILKTKEDPLKDEQYFYNYVLGLPYAQSDDRITPETILKSVVSNVNDQTGVNVIGVDTGLPIHYVVGNKKGIFHYGKCREQNPYGDLEAMLIRWPRSILVADQGGDLIGIRQLQMKYPSRVFLVFYRKDRKSTELAKWNDDGSIVVDRNAMMTLMVEHFREIGRMKLNGSMEDWKEFASHFGHIYRKKEETPFGMEYKWERNGPDHFAHSCLYMMVGLDRFGEQEASIIQANDWIEELPKSGDIVRLSDLYD